jgi:hypothetical protein
MNVCMVKNINVCYEGVCKWVYERVDVRGDIDE